MGNRNHSDQCACGTNGIGRCWRKFRFSIRRDMSIASSGADDNDEGVNLTGANDDCRCGGGGGNRERATRSASMSARVCCSSCKTACRRSDCDLFNAAHSSFICLSCATFIGTSTNGALESMSRANQRASIGSVICWVFFFSIREFIFFFSLVFFSFFLSVVVERDKGKNFATFRHTTFFFFWKTKWLSWCPVWRL